MVQLISHFYNKSNNLTFEDSVIAALVEVVGAFGIVVMSLDFHEVIIAPEMGSVIVLGIGESECSIASDVTPIVEQKRNVIYLDDNELAAIGKKTITFQK